MGIGIRRAWRGACGRVATAIGAGLLVVPLAAFPAPVQAQAQPELDIPAGRLSSSIRILARQTGISIATRESGVRQFQAKAVRGALSPAEALRRLLAGTPYRAVAIPGGFRIEKRPPTSALRPAARTPRQSAAPPPAPAPQIIVEGTKRAFAASDYPGGIKRFAVDDLARQGGCRGSPLPLAARGHPPQTA